MARAGGRLVFLQFNELNFEYVHEYVRAGRLPGFARLFADHGYVRTTSESLHELANPWIQWPTVHTGRDYADHGVFRLGDIVQSPFPHIYEVLESNGVSVGAISPFNARNNTRNPRFFVPDPWTRTTFSGSRDLRRLYDALVQIVDDYARVRIDPKAMVNLALGALPNIRARSLPTLGGATVGYLGRGRKWMRAVVCDRVLADAFLRHWKRDRPDFASLFLNGGAHLQHHYLFSSAAYHGPRRNPDWHVPRGADPLFDILRSYDQLLGELLRRLGNDRLIVATGLHQDPHERETFYYRLDDHAAFLDRIGIEYSNTYRLMTEDFVVGFPDADTAAAAERKLADVRSVECEDIFYVETGDSAHRTGLTWPNLFHIENRGNTLYIQLRPTSQAMIRGMKVQSGNVVVEDFDRLVSFAQYKNTHHVGDGYYIDTAFAPGELPAEFPLREIFDVILCHFGIDPAVSMARPVPSWLAGPTPSAGHARPASTPGLAAAAESTTAH